MTCRIGAAGDCAGWSGDRPQMTPVWAAYDSRWESWVSQRDDASAGLSVRCPLDVLSRPGGRTPYRWDRAAYASSRQLTSRTAALQGSCVVHRLLCPRRKSHAVFGRPPAVSRADRPACKNSSMILVLKSVAPPGSELAMIFSWLELFIAVSGPGTQSALTGPGARRCRGPRLSGWQAGGTPIPGRPAWQVARLDRARICQPLRSGMSGRPGRTGRPETGPGRGCADP